MRIPPGSYIEVQFELSYRAGDRSIPFLTTKRVLVKRVLDEKTGKEKPIEEIVDSPKIIKLGSGEVPRILEEVIMNTDIDLGKTFRISIPPEKAYGRWDPKKIERIPFRKFRERLDRGILRLDREGRRPKVGDIVYYVAEEPSEYYGRVVGVSERLVIVDRNHPLAGKTIDAEFRILGVVLPTDPKEKKLEMILRKYFGGEAKNLEYSILGGTLELRLSAEFFDKYPVIDEEAAKEIMAKIYIPKLLLLADKSELYGELGITRVRWIEEGELVKGVPLERAQQQRDQGAEQGNT